jgi:hypothetical protein
VESLLILLLRVGGMITLRRIVFMCRLGGEGKIGKSNRGTAHHGLRLWRGDLYKSIAKLRRAGGWKSGNDQVLDNGFVMIKRCISCITT